MNERPIVAFTVLATIAAASPARAHVRSRVTMNCEPVDEFGCAQLYWQGANCVPVEVYLNGFTMLDRHRVAKSIAAAAHAWSPSAVTCPDGTAPYLEIVPSMATAPTGAPAVRSDVHNVVVFVNSGWDDGERPWNAVALTAVTMRRDGRIADMDIEINADRVTWANLDPGAAPGDNGAPLPMDLQTAITHEFGHFIGLGHTCNAGDDDGTFDDRGNPVPPCADNLPAEIRETTMYAEVLPGETHQRTLAPDDIAGVCAIYPAAQDPHVCALDLPDDGCGCMAAGAGRGAAAAALALLALWAVRRSR
jgi:hypothetical protein